LNVPIQPHALGPLQRIALIAMRILMSLLGVMAWLRRRKIPLQIEQQRYGTLRDETLEVIRPASATDKRVAVVYVHGGGWIICRKEFYSSDLLFLAESGYTIFNLDYPLAPEHPHPIPLGSLLRALAWLQREHPEFEEIHLMGDSAGGNLAMMLGILIENPELRRPLDPKLLDLALPRPLSVVSLYGVLDRTSWLEHGFPGASVMLQSYAGRAAFEPEVGPELAITPVDLQFDRHPPCLLAIGTKDPLAESSRIAFERLYRNDGRMRLLEYEGEQHGFLNLGWRPNSQKLRHDIIDFLAASEATSAAEEMWNSRVHGSVAT